MMWWVEAGTGLCLIVLGWVMAFARVLPGPAWMWGRRDAVTGAPTPAVRASGAAQIAMGGGLVALAWVGIAPLPTGFWASYLIGLLLLSWSAHLSQRAALLHRTQLV
jgi:hypothetical protein